MKTIKIAELFNHISYNQAITDSGEILRVKCENGRDLVVMDASEYSVLSNALRMVFAAAGAASGDTISFPDMVENFDKLS